LNDDIAGCCAACLVGGEELVSKYREEPGLQCVTTTSDSKACKKAIKCHLTHKLTWVEFNAFAHLLSSTEERFVEGGEETDRLRVPTVDQQRVRSFFFFLQLAQNLLHHSSYPCVRVIVDMECSYWFYFPGLCSTQTCAVNSAHQLCGRICCGVAGYVAVWQDFVIQINKKTIFRR
jgi:hypothetical protein